MAKEEKAANTANTSNNIDLEEAKHERQQESDKKRNVLVEYDGENYQVKNEGDEKPIYESHDRLATIEFAKKIAEEHNIDMIISDHAKEAERKEKEESKRNSDREGEKRHEHRSEKRHEERREKRRYEERETEGPRNIIVEDDGRYYIVRNEGDRAKLYESKDKEATLDFARKVAKDHEVDLIVLDRHRHVRLEEKYSSDQEEKKHDRSSGEEKR